MAKSVTLTDSKTSKRIDASTNKSLLVMKDSTNQSTTKRNKKSISWKASVDFQQRHFSQTKTKPATAIEDEKKEIKDDGVIEKGILIKKSVNSTTITTTTTNNNTKDCFNQLKENKSTVQDTNDTSTMFEFNKMKRNNNRKREKK